MLQKTTLVLVLTLAAVNSVRGGCVIGDPFSAELEVCKQYREATCCLRQQDETLKIDVVDEKCDDTDKGRCFDYVQAFTCRICDPEYGDYRRDVICRDFAEGFYKACQKNSIQIIGPSSQTSGPCEVLGEAFADADAFWLAQGFVIGENPEKDEPHRCFTLDPLPGAVDWKKILMYVGIGVGALIVITSVVALSYAYKDELSGYVPGMPSFGGSGGHPAPPVGSTYDYSPSQYTPPSAAPYSPAPTYEMAAPTKPARFAPSPPVEENVWTPSSPHNGYSNTSYGGGGVGYSRPTSPPGRPTSPPYAGRHVPESNYSAPYAQPQGGQWGGNSYY